MCAPYTRKVLHFRFDPPRLPAVGCRWLYGRYFYSLGVEASSGQPPRYHGHPRRWHDDGSEKGGDNIGFSGHKKVKGDKVVAFCDRNCNVIAPFVSAPGNRNESPLLREALPKLRRIARAVGFDLHGRIVNLDGVYDCRPNRKAIFNQGMIPNINPNSG